MKSSEYKQTVAKREGGTFENTDKQPTSTIPKEEGRPSQLAKSQDKR